MKRIIFLLFLMIFLSSCNTAFLVSKDNVIHVKRGYIVIMPFNQFVEFIPSKIDTSLSLSENFAKYNLGKAFYLHGLSSKTINYLRIFGDTIHNGWVVVPVEFEYRQIKILHSHVSRQDKEYHERKIKIGDTIYIYQINIQNVSFLNAYPLLSEEKLRLKTKDYDD